MKIVIYLPDYRSEVPLLSDYACGTRHHRSANIHKYIHIQPTHQQSANHYFNKYCRADYAAKPTTPYKLHLFCIHSSHALHSDSSVDFHWVFHCPHLATIFQDVHFHSSISFHKICTFFGSLFLPCNVKLPIFTFYYS